MRRMTPAVLTAVAVLGLTACSSGGTGSPQTSAATSSAATSPAAPATLAVTAFSAPVGVGEQPPGVTHNTELVPVGASGTVKGSSANGRTTVTLEVAGLVPNRKYGAHAHTKACGQKAADSGPHYQDKLDPVQPSVDPAFANPKNEIWLDFETDASGKGQASATVEWVWRPKEANSVVVHKDPTNHHDHGKAGTAGERLACLTVPFTS